MKDKRINWISKQYSRFDLALTKISRPLAVVNTIANLSVAIVVGIYVFGFTFTVGFLTILGLGYVFHKSGFFMQTTKENFDQQFKELWEPQTKLLAAWISKYNRMTKEELDQEIQRLLKELRL